MTLTDARRAAAAIPTSGLDLLGQVIPPGSAAYDEARRVWNMAVDRYPALVVEAADAVDVVRTVQFAAQQQVPLAVRSGGHSVAGYGTLDGGVVLDLGQLKGFTVDADRRTLWAQPGVTTSDFVRQAHAFGLTLPTGDLASVGLGGLTLGGGMGWLVRKHGLTIDHLESVELVTADGRLIRANADELPDLFWALRGGGGNFGVATAFTFRLVEVSTVYGGALVLPATPDVLAGYVRHAAAAPDELSTIAFLWHAPPAPFIPTDYHGRLVLMVFGCYAGDPDRANRAIGPLRGLAAPLADTLGVLPFPDLYTYMAHGSERARTFSRGGFFGDLDMDTIDTILDAADHMPPLGLIQLRVLGGQMARVPSTATAFAHRSATLHVLIQAVWEHNDDEARLAREWAGTTWSQVASKSVGAYANFLGDEGHARVHQAYPEATYARLARIKKQYDPGNLFRLNQNILPAN